MPDPGWWEALWPDPVGDFRLGPLLGVKPTRHEFARLPLVSLAIIGENPSEWPRRTGNGSSQILLGAPRAVTKETLMP
jgi:hypothetical protein